MASMSEKAPVPLDLPVVDAAPPIRADAERNREKVLCAAARLIKERGVANVSMDAIAAAAGVGKGTLFRRFGDRAGLAQALLQQQTEALQEALIRGPAPLGPGAPPQERLKAMARAQFALMADHADLIAAADAGPPGVKARSAPAQFLRSHMGVLIREADPEADWEMVAELLMAPLTAESYLYWCHARGVDPERILAAFDRAVDRLLP